MLGFAIRVSLIQVLGPLGDTGNPSREKHVEEGSRQERVPAYDAGQPQNTESNSGFFGVTGADHSESTWVDGEVRDPTPDPSSISWGEPREPTTTISRLDSNWPLSKGRYVPGLWK